MSNPNDLTDEEAAEIFELVKQVLASFANQGDSIHNAASHADAAHRIAIAVGAVADSLNNLNLSYRQANKLH